MKSRIRHKKTPVVRKTISLPEAVFDLSAPKAAEFKDYSKYVQDLIQRDAAGKLRPVLEVGKAVAA